MILPWGFLENFCKYKKNPIFATQKFKKMPEQHTLTPPETTPLNAAQPAIFDFSAFTPR